MYCFKPCYKWNTFNTLTETIKEFDNKVLNLVINGIPSILKKIKIKGSRLIVLNLVINGIPSILVQKHIEVFTSLSGFKPCYKWNTFNTKGEIPILGLDKNVLNLVINGIPSIPNLHCAWITSKTKF